MHDKKRKKGITIMSAFEKTLNESNCKQVKYVYIKKAANFKIDPCNDG